MRLRWWVHPRPILHQQVPAPAGLAGKAWRVDRRAAPSREKAAPRREASGERYQRECPEWGRCLLEDAAARWNPLEVPQRPQHYGRPATLGARAGGEARRRPKVLPPLWTAGRVAPWVFGGVIRLSARGGKTGLREGEQPQIRRFRARLKLDEPEGSTNEGSLHVPTRSSAASAAEHRVQELRVLTFCLQGPLPPDQTASDRPEPPWQCGARHGTRARNQSDYRPKELKKRSFALTSEPTHDRGPYPSHVEVPLQRLDEAEVDEMWSFVGKKGTALAVTCP